MTFIENNLGFEYSTPEYIVFFGKKNSSLENLSSAYPQFRFKSLEQIHGSEIAESRHDSVNDRKADAHWTQEINLALVSKTADCTPVLAYDAHTKTVFAIHAGWRGVQQQIIPKALALTESALVFIGPHILLHSFEIQEDCFLALKDSTQLPCEVWYKERHADLHKIILSQIEELKSARVNSLLFDTKTDLRFHSYRRDKAEAGRQNSFIALKS